MKNRKTIIIIVLIVLALAGIASAGFTIYGKAQQKKVPNLSAMDALNYTLKNNPNGVITIGTIKNDEMSYKVYGKNGVELPNVLHTYEIGSLTKTFTAAIICKAVQEGKLSIDDEIDTYLDLPQKSHYPTVKELLTHTSGYKGYYFEPPMIGNFFGGKNDFYKISDDMIISQLGKTTVSEQKHEFNYSNFGYTTLGILLEKLYGDEYENLMNDFIKENLKLENTEISDGKGDLGNMWKWGQGDAYMSAGALKSNVLDMLQYARLQINGAVCDGECISILKEITATPAQYESLNIRMDGIGYGWIIDKKNGIVWHNGGTDNYNSYLGFDVEDQVAVVVLSNLPPSYRIPATVIGAKLLMEMRGIRETLNNPNADYSAH